MMVYINTIEYAEHIVLVKGNINSDESVLVRMHALNVLDDVLGDGVSGKSGQLQRSMEIIAKEGRGVIVLIREPRKTSLSDVVKGRMEGGKAVKSLRDYGIGAQILLDLGVRKMVLLSNTSPSIVALEGYGLEITGHRKIS